MTEIHSCSYFCERPECIKQRETTARGSAWLSSDARDELACQQLVSKLKETGREYRGTPLGGLLQWAAMHIENQHATASEMRQAINCAAAIGAQGAPEEGG